MLSITIMSVTFVVLCLIFIKPKWGTFLIWPVLFTYPNGWWYYHNFLPLNMGVDDFLCIALFLTVFIRRNFLGGVRLRLNYAFWTISAFTVIAAIANIAGSMDAAPVERIFYIKAILKFCVLWGLFYAVLHCIDDTHDLKMQFTMFSIGTIAGASIVILQYFFPYQTEIFAAPVALERGEVGFGVRASGAFMDANTAACMLGCSLMLVITAIRLQKTAISKMVVYAFICVLLVGIAVTRSRSGLMALVGALVLMAFLGQGKKFAWLVIIGAVVIAMTFAEARLLYTERIKDIYSGGIWGANVEGRTGTWSSYLETATTKDYLLGQGMTSGITKNGMESHSVYISLLTVYGIGSVFWALIALIIFLRKAVVLRRSADPLLSTISEGCIWALAAWGIYGTAADAISAMSPLYLLFYLVVLLDRGHNIAGEQQKSLLYEEQVGQPVLYPEEAEIY